MDSDPEAPHLEAPQPSDAMHEPEDRAIAKATGEFPKSDTLYGSKSRAEFLLTLFQAVEARAAFEGGWIAHRMTWLIVSQSFLFSAFALSAVNIEKFLAPVLVWLIAVMALTQAVAAWVSIRAAKAVNRELMDLRGRVDAAVKGLAPDIPLFGAWVILGKVRYGNISKTFSNGGLASRLIPSTLVCGWVLLLIALATEAVSKVSPYFTWR